MRVLHEIFHAMYKNNKLWFCLRIHIPTYAYGNVLKIIVCLNRCVYKTINPVIYGSPKIFSFFLFLSNESCGQEELLFKWCVYLKRIFIIVFLFFCISTMFLYDVTDDMIGLLSADDMLTLDDVDIEDIWFPPLLDGIYK